MITRIEKFIDIAKPISMGIDRKKKQAVRISKNVIGRPLFTFSNHHYKYALGLRYVESSETKVVNLFCAHPIK